MTRTQLSNIYQPIGQEIDPIGQPQSIAASGRPADRYPPVPHLTLGISEEMGDRLGEPQMPEETRFALAMNGGVSLAVWIGGVAYEFRRMAQQEGGWAKRFEVAPRIDVLVGTSAGGMNAAFLAAATLYGTDLGALRTLWLDRGGLESPPPPGRGHCDHRSGSIHHRRTS